MKSVIITGATSMIGTAVTEAVLHNCPTCRIYAIVRPNTARCYRLPHNNRISIVECDVGQYAKLPEQIQDSCDVFYHLAWTESGSHRNDNIEDQSRNIAYTLQALEAAHRLGCGKFIGAGSQAEYGIKDLEMIGPGTPVDPVQAYGVAKYAAGRLARMQAERFGMDCFWVRVFSVYGKYERETTMIQTAVRKLAAGERPSFTPSEQLWDYLYSADAGEAFCAIGEKATGNRVYCLGSGTARPLKDYIREMAAIVNPDIPVGIGDLPYPPGAVMHLCADIRDLQRDTGWKPAVDFKTGIRETYQWVLENRR